MPLRQSGMSHGGSPSGHDEYEMWDAAYVLGSLSRAEWREFEQQMADCASCRSAIGELSGIPALLSQLGPDDLVTIGGRDGSGPILPDVLLPSLLGKVKWRRRRSGLVTWTAGAAATAALAIGVHVGIAAHAPTAASGSSQVNESVQPMAQLRTNKLAAKVSLSSRGWGTSIAMDFTCLAPLNADHDTLAMVVVGRDGSHTRLATWVADPGHPANPAGSISMQLDQIAAVQVVSADNGQVLLEHSR
jgi:anti-sigma factor RsiW